MRIDDIKRTTAPETRDGKQWEVQLSMSPPRPWQELFKLSGESSVTIVPKRIVFDRDTAVFKSDEQRVEHWIRSIDTWIASTNARYATSLDEASREWTARADAATRNRDRIRQLNERFKNL